MRNYWIVAILSAQIVCAIFFVLNILWSILGFAPISWQISEFIELGAAVGLMLGVVSGAMMLRWWMRRYRDVQNRLRVASGAFLDLIDDRFTDWGLTPDERDVAMFVLKGFSTAEIAGFRGKSEGTVKAQTNAIYRKAGVTGRGQLMSLFVEDLLGEPLAPRAMAEAAAD